MIHATHSYTHSHAHAAAQRNHISLQLNAATHACALRFTSVTSGPVYTGRVGATSLAEGSMSARASNGSTCPCNTTQHAGASDMLFRQEKSHCCSDTDLFDSFSCSRRNLHLNLQHEYRISTQTMTASKQPTNVSIMCDSGITQETAKPDCKLIKVPLAKPPFFSGTALIESVRAR